MPAAQGHITVFRARRGADGKGIVSQVDWYAVSVSGTEAPASWTANTPPSMTQTLRYLWRYTETTYSDGSSVSTEPGVVGVYGRDGLSYRYSRWAAGVEYRNDNNPYYRDSSGQGFIDVALEDDISIYDPSSGGTPPSAFICRKTHVSAATPVFSTGGNWTREGNVFTSDTIAHGGETWVKIGFGTTAANTVITVKITASSEQNYDWGYICGLDADSSDTDYLARVSGTDTQTVAITVQTAGSHFFYAGYKKDVSTSSNNDNVVVEIVSVTPVAPLEEGEHWEEINSMTPILTALVLANKIKSRSLDVDDLTANTAFITKLTAQTAFIDQLNTKSLKSKEITTVSSGNGFLQMLGNVLQMFNPDGDERLKIHGGELSSLAASTYYDPSSAKTAAVNKTFVSRNETSVSKTTEICARTITSESLLSVPRIEIFCGCLYVSTTVGELKEPPAFQYTAELLIDGVARSTAYKTAEVVNGEVQWNHGGDSLYLPGLKESVGAGAHTVGVRLTIGMLSGMGEGDDCSASMSGAVAVNAVTWAQSIQKTEIANNGFRVALASNVYFSVYLSGDANIIEMRNGNYGLRVASTGLYKTTDGINWVAF